MSNSKRNKNMPSKADVQTTKLNRVVDTENEFAAEYGEALYGSQAREAFEQKKENVVDEDSMFKP